MARMSRTFDAILIALAIACRAAAVLVLQSHLVPRSTYEHGEIAANLLAGRGFSMRFLGADGPTSQQAPVYPAFVSLAYAIFGVDSPQALLALELGQAILGGLLVLGVLRLARAIVPELPWLAWTAALVVALHPTLIYAATHVQVASLGATLLVWTLALAYQAGSTRQLRDAVYTGLLIALLTVTDPILALASLGVAWAIVWKEGKRPGAGLLIRRSFASRAFPRYSLRLFPPLAKGGLGGVVAAPPATGPSLSLCVALSEAPNPAPLAPPSQGGERDRWLAASFDRPQQKRRPQARPAGTAHTNVPSAQATARACGPVPILAVIAVVALAGVSPWLVRNYLVHGEFVAVKSTFGYAFWQGNCALSAGTDKVVRSSVDRILGQHQSPGDWKGLNRTLWAARHEAGYIDDVALTKDDYRLLGSLSEPERSRVLFRRALKDLRAEPFRYGWLCLRRLRYFLLFDETNPKSRVLAYRIPHVGLTIFGGLGLILAGSRLRRRLTPTIVTATAIVIFHTLTIVSARFHIPLEPILAVWGAAGLAMIVERAAARSRHSTRSSATGYHVEGVGVEGRLRVVHFMSRFDGARRSGVHVREDQAAPEGESTDQ